MFVCMYVHIKPAEAHDMLVLAKNNRYTCMYVCMYTIYMYVCMYVYDIHVCMYVGLYVCTYEAYGGPRYAGASQE